MTKLTPKLYAAISDILEAYISTNTPTIDLIYILVEQKIQYEKLVAEIHTLSHSWEAKADNLAIIKQGKRILRRLAKLS